MTELSVVIVSFNTRQLLKDCLTSIYQSANCLESFAVEIIVVDNGSSDGSAAMVKLEFPQVKLIKNSQNFGFAKANNQGIQLCRGSYILLLNSDTSVPPEAFASMIQFIKENPSVGILGPKLFNSSGSIQPSGRRFPSLWRELIYYSSLWSRFPGFFSRLFDFGWRRDFTKLCGVDEVSGAVMLIRREVLDKIGMLDERFFMYYEDADFCFRARKAGFKVIYFPQATIIHHQAESAKKVVSQANIWLWRSAYLYSQKWRKPWEAWILKQLFLLKGFHKVELQ